MKTLIAESINITDLSMGSRVVTIFNDPSTEQQASSKYFNLIKLCGTSVRVSFLYTESDATKHAFHLVKIPTGLTEIQVMDLIIHEIQEKLKS